MDELKAWAAHHVNFLSAVVGSAIAAGIVVSMQQRKQHMQNTHNKRKSGLRGGSDVDLDGDGSELARCVMMWWS